MALARRYVTLPARALKTCQGPIGGLGWSRCGQTPIALAKWRRRRTDRHPSGGILRSIPTVLYVEVLVSVQDHFCMVDRVRHVKSPLASRSMSGKRALADSRVSTSVTRELLCRLMRPMLLLAYMLAKVVPSSEFSGTMGTGVRLNAHVPVAVAIKAGIAGESLSASGVVALEA
jgi:hypothetical protein